MIDNEGIYVWSFPGEIRRIWGSRKLMMMLWVRWEWWRVWKDSSMLGWVWYNINRRCWIDELGSSGDDGTSTKWTSGVWLEPVMYAIQVEHVLAIRNLHHLFLHLKLPQTNTTPVSKSSLPVNCCCHWTSSLTAFIYSTNNGINPTHSLQSAFHHFIYWKFPHTKYDQYQSLRFWLGLHVLNFPF